MTPDRIVKHTDSAGKILYFTLEKTSAGFGGSVAPLGAALLFLTVIVVGSAFL